MNTWLLIRTRVFGCTQAEMAEIAAVTQNTISRWENGVASPTQAAQMRIRAEARRRQLDWDDTWFFEPHALTQ